MSQKYEKLKTLLKELFQLDQPDLDFGLYRIMHTKSAEVMQFLDKDLLPQVTEAFSLYKTADKAELEKELAKSIEQAQALGADPGWLYFGPRYSSAPEPVAPRPGADTASGAPSVYGSEAQKDAEGKRQRLGRVAERDRGVS